MYKHKFLFFLTLLFWADTFNSARGEYSQLDRLLISIIILTVIFAQALILKALASKIRNKLTINIALGSIITFNAFSLSFAMMEKYIQTSFAIKVTILLLILFTSISLLNMMDEVKKTRKWIMTLIYVLLAGNIIHATIKLNSVIGDAHPKLDNYKYVQFKEKPNIYIILLDSLIPESILKKHMGLEKVPYHDVLNNKLYRFKNFFVNDAPTRPSLNAFLAFDKKYLTSLGEKSNGLFQGNVVSPLFKIFNENGYETNTSIDSGYFGVGKGPYVDNYKVRKKFSACSFIYKNIKSYVFFGYCDLINRPFMSKYVNPKTRIDFVLDQFHEGLSRSKPQIFVVYIYSPGHTPSNYNHKNQESKDSYITRYKSSSKSTASILMKIIDFVEQKDPTGFIYVLGDHGPWLSRRASYEKEREFFVQDRYAVYGGFFPPHKCQESFSKPYSSNFTTAIHGMHMIIRCLSGGKNSFVKLDDFSLTYDTIKKEDSYANYLYE